MIQFASKPNIKRKYKLTYKKKFYLWMGRLRLELIRNDLVFVIDSSDEMLTALSQDVLSTRKALVREIIVSLLDEQYHNQILSEKVPKIILDTVPGESSWTLDSK